MYSMQDKLIRYVPTFVFLYFFFYEDDEEDDEEKDDYEDHDVEKDKNTEEKTSKF